MKFNQEENGLLLSSIPIEKLELRLAEIVRREIKHQLGQKHQDDSGRERYLTRSETIELLKISYPTLFRYEKDGILKRSSNTPIRYRRGDVLKLLEKGVKP
jgi:hypothetical protein